MMKIHIVKHQKSSPIRIDHRIIYFLTRIYFFILIQIHNWQPMTASSYNYGITPNQADCWDSLKAKFNKITSFSFLKTGINFGTLIACILFIFYFYILPDILAFIWPYLLNLSNQIPLFIWSVVAINFLITTGYSITMYFVYKNKYSILQKYRISNEQWPWQTDYERWKKQLTKTVLVIFFNTLILTPILLYFDCQKSFAIKMSMQQIPNKFTNLWQFAFFLIANQIWSYLMHALIHQRPFYWIHKWHHQYNISVCIAGLYVHPVQYLISSIISTSLGYKLLVNFTPIPVHIFTFILWLIFRLFQIHDSHSGYEWPWGISSILPFSTTHHYHNWHHRNNLGNYSGILYFMDSLFNTNAQFWKQQIKKQEN